MLFVVTTLTIISSDYPKKNICVKSRQRHRKGGLRTTVPFAIAHLEIFHCTHHPVIPKSDLYFTFRSTLNALSTRTSTVTGLIYGFGKWSKPQHAPKWV